MLVVMWFFCIVFFVHCINVRSQLSSLDGIDKCSRTGLARDPFFARGAPPKAGEILFVVSRLDSGTFSLCPIKILLLPQR